jgi:hypothetical protein
MRRVLTLILTKHHNRTTQNTEALDRNNLTTASDKCDIIYSNMSNWTGTAVPVCFFCGFVPYVFHVCHFWLFTAMLQIKTYVEARMKFFPTFTL